MQAAVVVVTAVTQMLQAAEQVAVVQAVRQLGQ
jgi:hypothetical protein